jgi:hypothetical protein
MVPVRDEEENLDDIFDGLEWAYLFIYQIF